MKTTFINKKGLIKIRRNKYADYNIVFPYKRRLIDPTKPVLVYKNLNKNMYSIKQHGVVVAHGERLCLAKFSCIVNEKGRKRVLKTKHKNVHAYIKGLYDTSGCGTSANKNDLPVQIKYDPYKFSFFYCDNLTIHTLKINGGMFCILDKNGVAAAYTNTEPIY